MASKQASNYEIDNTDRQILSILMEDGKTPYTEIASKLFVSGGTVHVRIKKMERMGIIQKQQLIIDYRALGYDIAAFLGIFLSSSSMYEQVAAQLEKIPEMVGLHYTTGAYSMFAKIWCRDTDHLMEVLHNKIQNVEGIQRTETLISLQESINRPLSVL